jgi:RNA polymerase sigma-70 factor (ECF subfamily)
MATMTRPSPTDEQLIADFRNGGPAALLNELVRRHLDRVLSLIRQMGVGQSDADDVAQEVFIRAFKGLAGFHGRARFSTWLTAIALNAARTHLTRRTKAEGRERQDESPGDRLAASDDAILCRELDAEIAAALGELSPPLRAALVLTTLQGIGIAEAARIEGCSMATIYWRVHEARKILKAKLRRYLES